MFIYFLVFCLIEEKNELICKFFKWNHPTFSISWKGPKIHSTTTLKKHNNENLSIFDTNFNVQCPVQMTWFTPLRRIGCWATRLTNLSKAKRLLAMNSFSDVLWSVVTSSRLPAPPPLPFPPPPSKELEAIFTRVVPTRLFSGAGGMMRPRGPCFSAIFSWRPAKYCSFYFYLF